MKITIMKITMKKNDPAFYERTTEELSQRVKPAPKKTKAMIAAIVCSALICAGCSGSSQPQASKTTEAETSTAATTTAAVVSELKTEEQDGEYVLTKYKGRDEEVVIPDNVTHIGELAFYESVFMKRVSFPEGVTSIGDSAFITC